MTPSVPPKDPNNPLPGEDTPSSAMVLWIALGVGASGLASLIGLLSGHRSWVYVTTNGGPLAALTALGLIAATAILALRSLNATRENAAMRRIDRTLVTLIVSLGLLVFTLRSMDVIPTPHGQLPIVSLAFAMIGVSLWLAAIRTSGRRLWLQLPLLPVLWLALLVVLARFYGIRTVNSYFEWLLFPVQTAIPLGLLGLGVLLLHPRSGVWGILSSRHTGGMLARIAVPVLLALPFTVGWIRMQALRSGQHDVAGAFAQFSTTNIVMFCGFILFSAHVLNRIDARRQETLESLRAANAELEARIAEQRMAEAAREESERQLFQAQKMEAMGVLASGIAHDFNNILTVILLNAEEADATPRVEPELKRNIGEIRKSGERAAGLIRQIMAFGRNETSARGPVSLAEVIAETDDLLRPVLPAGITLKTSVAPRLPPIHADSGQLRQVLLNLANNALHALEGRPGSLEISAEPLRAEEALPTGLEPGAYAVVAVRDSGRGMDIETAKRIFDPFFTTKPPGKGTGLGLSVVHGIMRLHGGAVTVRSEPDRGTEFRLYLPAEAEHRSPET